MSTFDAGLLANQWSSSLLTYVDDDSGDASRMKNSATSSASAIDAQRLGLTVRLASSRKVRSARIRYHGLAKLCREACSAGASLPSPARL